jgi:hypothetical protein
VSAWATLKLQSTSTQCVGVPGQQSFEPACVPTGLHPNPYLLAHSRQASIELLRFLAMHQSLFLELSRVGIHQSNLLKLGVEIYS